MSSQTITSGSRGPHVALDARALIGGGGGLRRYTAELLRGLQALSVDVTAWIAGWHLGRLRSALQAELDRLQLAVPVAATRAPGRLLYDQPGLGLWPYWPRRLPPPTLLPGAFDLFHAVHWPLPLDARRPMVLTIHDLIALRHPEWVPPNVLAVHRAIAALAPRAAQVIVDSEATRAEVLALTKTPPERLTVVPLGVNHERFARAASPAEQARVRRRYSLTQPFFLTVGSIEPRRNTAAIVAAYDQLCHDGEPSCDLVIVGARIGADPAFAAQLAAPRRGVVHVLERVSDADLVALMQAAAGFVFVSLAEGFGLPVLEAMAAGCPVIAAAATSLPEVAGDAALLVDPREPEAIAAALRRLATDPALAADLRRRGQERAAGFTWEQTARATWEVYRKALA